MPAPAADPTPRHARSRRRWPLRIGLVVLACVLVAAAGVVGYAYQASRSATDNLNRTDLMPGTGGSAGTPEWEEVTPDPGSSGGPAESPGETGPGGAGGAADGTDSGAADGAGAGTGSAGRAGTDGALNVVLMGSDSRDPGDPRSNGRSDTLMLLHLDADRRSASVTSFPRDMYVPIPGHGMNKINAAYAYGGSALTIRTLQDLLAIEVDHAALVSFEGFVDLTDDLGGVTIDNDYAFSTRGHTFDEGRITLSGEQALAFVRARYELPNGDLDRAENQRKVVEAILAKGLSGDTIANPRKFSNFVAGIAGNVTVDQQLSDAEIRRLALSLRMGPRDIDQVQAPLNGYATVDGVGSVDVVDRDRLDDLGHALRTDGMDDYLKNGG